MATLVEDYQALIDNSREANERRKQQITSIFDETIARYRLGGSFGKGYEAAIGRQKVQDVGRATQTDISSGLSGLRDRGTEWESTVGAGARLKLEDLRMERLSSAQLGYASFLERIENPYPDLGSLQQAYEAQGSISGSGSGISMTEKLAQARSSNWAFGGLGGGGGGGGGGSTFGGTSYKPRTPEEETARNKKIQEAEDVRKSMSEQSQLTYTPEDKTATGEAGITAKSTGDVGNLMEQFGVSAGLQAGKFQWNPNSGVPYETWVKEMKKLGHTDLGPKIG